MHKYLRSVGFSKELNRKMLKSLLVDVMKTAEQKSYKSIDNESMIAEFCKDFANRIGICVRGEYDENDVMYFDYYFPYLRGEGVTSSDELDIERHAEKMSYAGMCDDSRVGVSLIFYLQNMVSYLKVKDTDVEYSLNNTLTLTGLADQGKVMYPIEKTPEDVSLIEERSADRKVVLDRAKLGDEDAIDYLMFKDMDTFAVIKEMIKDNDVYSLVDTYFMPTGLECDQYAILGEIIHVEKVTNSLTGELVYILRLNVNDLEFDICINALDLFGEPAVGRRFKGTIWMQGKINFAE